MNKISSKNLPRKILKILYGFQTFFSFPTYFNIKNMLPPAIQRKNKIRTKLVSNFPHQD